MHVRPDADVYTYRIKWQPVILSFTFSSKETKAGKDPLLPFRSRLEELDIQAVLPYDRSKTTHVVATKRNTAKCLQALINGRYVVDHTFIDALLYVTTPSNLDEPESLSPLEEDFDEHWPNALDHVPPPSKEPGQRPAELFAPDPARQTVFEDYIFIFCDKRQYESLEPPITNACGRALHFPMKQGTTTVAEIVSYFQEAMGRKKGKTTAEPTDASEHVVLVRFAADKGHETWANQVQEDVQRILGIQSIEQNEFLDTILTKEAAKLNRKAPSHDGKL